MTHKPWKRFKILYLNSGFAHPENRHVSLFPWQVYSPPWWVCLQAYWGALSVPRVTWNSPIFAHVLNLDSFRRNLYIYYRSLWESIHQTFCRVHHWDIWFKREAVKVGLACIGAISATNFRLQIWPSSCRHQFTGHSAMCITETLDSKRPMKILVHSRNFSHEFLGLCICYAPTISPAHHFHIFPLCAVFTKLYHNLH
jgi:hypothetical protein